MYEHDEHHHHDEHDEHDEHRHDDDDGGDDLAPVELRLTHDGMPIHGWNRGEPIPNLDRIPQARWRAVLRPLSHATRQSAKAYAQTDVVAASVLVGELWLDDVDARNRAVSAPPAQMPTAVLPGRREGRQVNFRLGAGEYDRLSEAAKLFAMRPSALARVLTIRGVDRALYEHRRDA